MTLRGSLAIRLLTGGLLLGGCWLLWESRLLRDEIREVQRQRLSEATARSAQLRPPVSAPNGAGHPELWVPSSEKARAIKEQNAANQIHDLAQVINSGLAGQLRWKGWQTRKLDEVIDPFASLIGLSADKVENLKQTIAQGRDAIAAGVALESKVSQPADNQVLIEFGDLSVAQNSAAELETAVKEQIGDDAYALYDGLGFRGAVTTLLSNGALNGSTRPVASRNYTIVRVDAGTKYTYNITQRTTPPNGGGFGGFGGGGGAGKEYLEFNLGTALYRLLPPGFEQ